MTIPLFTPPMKSLVLDQVIIINDNYYPSLSHFIIHFIFLVVQLENDPKQVVGCGCKSLEKEDYYALLLTSFADIPGV